MDDFNEILEEFCIKFEDLIPECRNCKHWSKVLNTEFGSCSSGHIHIDLIAKTNRRPYTHKDFGCKYFNKK